MDDNRPPLFDIEERWPDLFVGLDDVQRWAVVQSLACSWHEGWVPNREDVKRLTDTARAKMDGSKGDRGPTSP